MIIWKFSKEHSSFLQEEISCAHNYQIFRLPKQYSKYWKQLSSDSNILIQSIFFDHTFYTHEICHCTRCGKHSRARSCDSLVDREFVFIVPRWSSSSSRQRWTSSRSRSWSWSPPRSRMCERGRWVKKEDAVVDLTHYGNQKHATFSSAVLGLNVVVGKQYKIVVRTLSSGEFHLESKSARIFCEKTVSGLDEKFSSAFFIKWIFTLSGIIFVWYFDISGNMKKLCSLELICCSSSQNSLLHIR